MTPYGPHQNSGLKKTMPEGQIFEDGIVKIPMSKAFGTKFKCQYFRRLAVWSGICLVFLSHELSTLKKAMAS